VNFISNIRGVHCFGSSRTKRNAGGKITMYKEGHPAFWEWYTLGNAPLIFLSKWS